MRDVHFSLSLQGTACFGIATPIEGMPLHALRA